MLSRVLYAKLESNKYVDGREIAICTALDSTMVQWRTHTRNKAKGTSLLDWLFAVRWTKRAIEIQRF